MSKCQNVKMSVSNCYVKVLTCRRAIVSSTWQSPKIAALIFLRRDTFYIFAPILFGITMYVGDYNISSMEAALTSGANRLDVINERD